MSKISEEITEHFRHIAEVEEIMSPKGVSTSAKIFALRPKPLTQQVKYPAHFLNASFHTEKTAEGYQQDLFSPLFSGDDRDKREITKVLTNIKTRGFTGIDLNIRQKQAMQGLFSIGQKQNISPARPYVILDSISALYEVVLDKNVKKKKSGKYSFLDFSGKETKELQIALEELSKTPQQVIMKWKDGEKQDKNTFSLYTTEQPLITIEYLKQDIPEADLDGITEDAVKKTGKIKISFLPQILLDYHRYFKLLPLHLAREIRERCGVKKVTEPMLNFIEWLHRQENIEVRRTRESLTNELKLSKWVKAGRKKLVNDTLLNCYQIAKDLGYLREYRVGEKGKFELVDVFTLNPYKFDHLQPKKLKEGVENDGLLLQDKG